MKKSIVLLVLCLFALTGWSAEGWMTDFEKAKKKAMNENKTLLLDFSGSDWCSWCIKLDEECFRRIYGRLMQRAFGASSNDFPREKSKQSEALQSRIMSWQSNMLCEFPTVLLINQEGTLIEKTGYHAGGAENYIDHIKSLIETLKKRNSRSVDWLFSNGIEAL